MMKCKMKYEIKRKFIEIGKKYDDSYGEDIPIGYIKQKDFKTTKENH